MLFFLFSSSAKIATGAVVCVESEIRGDVSIGEHLLLISCINCSAANVPDRNHALCMYRR